MNYWNIRKKSLPTSIQRTFKGVNRLDSFSVSEDFDTDQKNMTTALYPAASVRPGYTVPGELGGRMAGFGVWKQSELNALSAGFWYRYNGSSFSAVTSGLNTAVPWSFCNFQGNLTGINLIGANGIDPIKRYDGSTVQNLSGAPAGGNYIESFADRLWCAVGNELKFSAYRLADDWTTVNGDDADPGYITVETADGETINGLKAGFGHMTIFKPNSIHELFGYSPQDYTIKPVSHDVGALSNQAIVTVDGVMYFIHRTGLYKYQGGSAPSKSWSSAIQDYIDRINPSQASKVCMGTNGKMLYIGIPLDTAVDPDTIIEYNTEYGTFSVWKDFQPLCMTDIAGTVYIGDVDSRVKKLGGTTDWGTPISWYRITKPYNQGSLAQRTRIKRAWIVADIPSGSSLTVSISKTAEGNDFETIPTGPGPRIVIPTMSAYNANYVRFKFEGTGPVTIREFAMESESLPIV